jgi:hypothetical protein
VNGRILPLYSSFLMYLNLKEVFFMGQLIIAIGTVVAIAEELLKVKE